MSVTRGDGNVCCVDALTGILQWKFATGDIVHASPAVANNTVYIGSRDSYLYALDTDTGQEKWRFKPGIFRLKGWKQDPLQRLQPDGGLNSSASMTYVKPYA
ncbi:MAG TPA: PQQ-binding-like beta-propeller repeat protein [Pyrinomonadaceae bacterium]|nr:PQQ-binding-like beta-propeller repeat protein [Pyrinomonadaceae bacterium]